MSSRALGKRRNTCRRRRQQHIDPLAALQPADEQKARAAFASGLVGRPQSSSAPSPPAPCGADEDRSAGSADSVSLLRCPSTIARLLACSSGARARISSSSASNGRSARAHPIAIGAPLRLRIRARNSSSSATRRPAGSAAPARRRAARNPTAARRRNRRGGLASSSHDLSQHRSRIVPEVAGDRERRRSSAGGLPAAVVSRRDAPRRHPRNPARRRRARAVKHMHVMPERAPSDRASSCDIARDAAVLARRIILRDQRRSISRSTKPAVACENRRNGAAAPPRVAAAASISLRPIAPRARPSANAVVGLFAETREILGLQRAARSTFVDRHAPNFRRRPGRARRTSRGEWCQSAVAQAEIDAILDQWAPMRERPCARRASRSARICDARTAPAKLIDAAAGVIDAAAKVGLVEKIFVFFVEAAESRSGRRRRNEQFAPSRCGNSGEKGKFRCRRGPGPDTDSGSPADRW